MEFFKPILKEKVATLLEMDPNNPELKECWRDVTGYYRGAVCVEVAIIVAELLGVHVVVFDAQVGFMDPFVSFPCKVT